MNTAPRSGFLTTRALTALLLMPLLAVLTLAEPASAKKKDQVPEGTVSTIQDERIVESSGLALSIKHDDLAYTINDRGAHPMVYAVQVSTGEVVGVTDVGSLDVEDTESIAVDADGTLWLGDLGDNDHQRDDVSIIAFPEPGPGDHHLSDASRYGVTFPDGPVDVEGMLVHPTSHEVFLVSKNRNGLGTVYRLPAMTPGATVTAEDLGVDAPQAVTDGTFTHSGRWALLRTNTEVWTYDPKTWRPVGKVETPKLAQGESVTVERGDQSMLLGSEGKGSPIVRVPLADQPADSPPIDLTAEPGAGSHTPAGIALAVTGALALAIVAVLGRRRAREDHAVVDADRNR